MARPPRGRRSMVDMVCAPAPRDRGWRASRSGLALGMGNQCTEALRRCATPGKPLDLLAYGFRMTTELRLETVTAANFDVAIGLKVRPDQEHLVAPVMKSL